LGKKRDRPAIAAQWHGKREWEGSHSSQSLLEEGKNRSIRPSGYTRRKGQSKKVLGTQPGRKRKAGRSLVSVERTRLHTLHKRERSSPIFRDKGRGKTPDLCAVEKRRAEGRALWLYKGERRESKAALSHCGVYGIQSISGEGGRRHTTPAVRATLSRGGEEGERFADELNGESPRRRGTWKKKKREHLVFSCVSEGGEGKGEKTTRRRRYKKKTRKSIISPTAIEKGEGVSLSSVWI